MTARAESIGDPLIWIAGTEKLTGWERTTIGRKVRAGQFPAPIYVAGRRAWKLSTIERWIEEQVARGATP